MGHGGDDWCCFFSLEHFTLFCISWLREGDCAAFRGDVGPGGFGAFVMISQGQPRKQRVMQPSCEFFYLLFTIKLELSYSTCKPGHP